MQLSSESTDVVAFCASGCVFIIFVLSDTAAEIRETATEYFLPWAKTLCRFWGGQPKVMSSDITVHTAV